MDAYYGKTTLISSDVFWLTLQQIHQTLPVLTFLSLPSCQEVFHNVQSTFGCSNVNRFSWQFHSLVRNGTASKLWRPQWIHRTWEELARKSKSFSFWCPQNVCRTGWKSHSDASRSEMIQYDLRLRIYDLARELWKNLHVHWDSRKWATIFHVKKDRHPSLDRPNNACFNVWRGSNMNGVFTLCFVF